MRTIFDENSEQLATNKLLLLYGLKELNSSIEHENFTKIFSSTQILNYFSIKQYISELMEANLIIKEDRDNKEFINISEKGLKMLKLFNDRIDSEQMNIISKYINDNRKSLLFSNFVSASVTSSDDGNIYANVNLTIDDGNPSFSLNIRAKDRKEADNICIKWKHQAPELVKEITKLLTL